MKQLLFIIILLISLLTLPLFTIFAQATPSSLPDEALEELKAKLATRAADIQKNIQTRSNVYIGPIRSISAKKLTIITKKGSLDIAVSSETIIKENGAITTINTLSEGQRIVVIGNGPEPIAARKIFIPSATPPTRAIMGTITEFESSADESPRFTVMRRGKEEAILLEIAADVSISLRGGAATSLDVLTEGTLIVAAGREEEIGTITATRILVLSGQKTAEWTDQPRSTSSAQAQSVLEMARARLATHRGATEDLFELKSFSAQTWTDASLGVPQAGNVYAQVLTPGYKIIFQSPVQQYEIHTDESGNSMILVDPYAVLE